MHCPRQIVDAGLAFQDKNGQAKIGEQVGEGRPGGAKPDYGDIVFCCLSGHRWPLLATRRPRHHARSASRRQRNQAFALENRP